MTKDLHRLPPTPRQLTLDLVGTPSFAADDFVVSKSNSEAYAVMERWPQWPDRLMLLIGPAGVGKSHLCALWAARSGASAIHSDARLEEVLASRDKVVLVEDCDRSCYDEHRLFHLINDIREGGGWGVLTARAGADQWGIRTPDLLSRVRLAPVHEINEADPSLLRAVLVKLLADRQIDADEDLVAAVELNCDRSTNAIQSFVATLDEEALSTGRRISRHLLNEIMRKRKEAALDD